jgi:hypothetical protein
MSPKTSLRLSLLVLGFAAFSPFAAFAQEEMQCIANYASTNSIRHEGLTELVGEVYLLCSGGTPTAAGEPVPLMELRYRTNPPVNITNRNLAPFWPDALLAIDEPYSVANQRVCGAQGDIETSPGVCSITGTGDGTGGYTGAPGRPNIFHARRPPGLENELVWVVPVDPPGNGGAWRILRIMNVRVNASQLELPPPSYPPNLLRAELTLKGGSPVQLLAPEPIVAYPIAAVNVEVAPASLCGAPDAPMVVTFSERFPSALRKRSEAVTTDPNVSPPPGEALPLGVEHRTESGLFNLSFPVLQNRGDLRRAGLADHGTRVFIRISNVPPGRKLRATAVVPLMDQRIGGQTGFARLVWTDERGRGPFRPVPADEEGMARVPRFGNDWLAVYEILSTDTTVFETFSVPIRADGPAIGSLKRASVKAGLAPIGRKATGGRRAPIPRFAPPEGDPIALEQCKPPSRPK